MIIWNNKIAAFLAYSNIWVASSVAALTWISQYFFSSFDLNYVAFTFFSTLAFYSYARFFEGYSDKDQKSPITKWHKKNRSLLIMFMVLSSLSCLYLIMDFSLLVIIIIVVSSIFGLLYPVPYILGKWSGIRHIAGLKLFVIALIWTSITSFIPAVESGYWGDGQAWQHIIQRFLFVTAITIPFDVRDSATDHPEIDTLPQRIGAKRALIITLFLGLIIELSLFLQYIFDVLTGWDFLALFIGIEIAIVLAYRSFPIKKDLYYSFVIEGTPIIMFLLVYIFQYF